MRTPIEPQTLRHWSFCWPTALTPWYHWFFWSCRTQLDAKTNALYVDGRLLTGWYTRLFGVEYVTW